MDIQSVASSSVASQAFGSVVQGGTGLANVPASVPAPSVADVAPTADQLQKAVDTVNSVVAGLSNNVEFSIDDSTGIKVVKVLEKDSNTIIRQLPAEEVINFARTLDKIKGLLFKQTV